MIDFESHRSGNSYIHFQFCDYMDSNVNIHNSFEFIYICHGHYNLYINAKKYEMKDDTCALILPGQIHHIETVEPFDSPNYKNPQKPFLCFFSADTVKEFSYYIQNFALVSPVFKLSYPNFLNFVIDTKNPFIKKSFLYFICGNAANGGIEKIRLVKNNDLIYKIVTYIDNNNISSLSLKKMAVDLGFNYSYLSNRFNKLFNMSFMDFVNNYRVEHSKKLLIDTHESVGFIALECGFNNIRSFNRAFYAKENVTPSEYRRHLTEKRNR